jgi:hypothetical protein
MFFEQLADLRFLRQIEFAAAHNDNPHATCGSQFLDDVATQKPSTTCDYNRLVLPESAHA